jgi:uncharacterized membrane protein YuzA (DUF378 family)
MKVLNLVTLILVIVGGVNWGLVALANVNLVAALFGDTPIARVVYLLVGLSALYQFVPFVHAIRLNEPRGEATAPRV